MIQSLLEAAAAANPEEEDVGRQLCFAYVKAEDYRALQAVRSRMMGRLLATHLARSERAMGGVADQPAVIAPNRSPNVQTALRIFKATGKTTYACWAALAMHCNASQAALQSGTSEAPTVTGACDRPLAHLGTGCAGTTFQH